MHVGHYGFGQLREGTRLALSNVRVDTRELKLGVPHSISCQVSTGCLIELTIPWPLTLVVPRIQGGDAVLLGANRLALGRSK